jgi:hypothetical protein
MVEHNEKSSIFQSIKLATGEPGGPLRVFSLLMSLDCPLAEQLRDGKRPVLCIVD